NGGSISMPPRVPVSGQAVGSGQRRGVEVRKPNLFHEAIRQRETGSQTGRGEIFAFSLVQDLFATS
ncbi:MAG: hypothetical protein WAM53_02975, partial [Terrimicrobiaceae bacterium]